MTISAVAGTHGIHPNRSFHWWILAEEGDMSLADVDEGVVRTPETMELKKQIRGLERLFVKKARIVMSGIAAKEDTSGGRVRDLMAEAIETRFGMIHQHPHTIRWLSDNESFYVALETRSFAKIMEWEVCRTPLYSPQSSGMTESFAKDLKGLCSFR
jgi:transposase-like protein